MPESEVVKGIGWALSSLSTAGMIIAALSFIIFVLAKFKVFNKIIDTIVAKKHLSTGMNEDKLADIQTAIDRLLQNDEQIKDKITSIEHNVQKNSNRMDSIEKSQFETQMERYKDNVFNKDLPLIDRMAPGIKFLQNGGNSDTKKYLLDVLAHEDLIVWNGLCKALKAQQYWQHRKGDA